MSEGRRNGSGCDDRLRQVRVTPEIFFMLGVIMLESDKQQPEILQELLEAGGIRDKYEEVLQKYEITPRQNNATMQHLGKVTTPQNES